MNAAPSERSIGSDPERPPENELTAFLWVLAVLIAVLELAWWLAGRLYS